MDGGTLDVGGNTNLLPDVPLLFSKLFHGTVEFIHQPLGQV